jgi:hypothetical protein
MVQRQNSREQRHLQWGINMAVVYPDDLERLPIFSLWLSDAVAFLMISEEKPTNDQLQASKLLERVATTYRAMFAKGMHLRVRSAEEEKVTCDSGVASSIFRPGSGRGRDNFTSFEAAEYIGWIEEILELEYHIHCCVVLVCSWVRASPEVGGACVSHDRYGFTVGNFARTNPLGAKSFAFPTQCQQVFFVDDTELNNTWGGDWKVVCRTKVWGRRGEPSVDQAKL